jgi:hypothetical protein
MHAPTPARNAPTPPRISGRHPAPAPALDPVQEALAQRLHTEHSIQVGRCALVVNQVVDCVIGTDPDGIDVIVAFTATLRGCQDAVRWASRFSANAPQRVM